MIKFNGFYRSKISLYVDYGRSIDYSVDGVLFRTIGVYLWRVKKAKTEEALYIIKHTTGHFGITQVF
jgi:hypothetical protein